MMLIEDYDNRQFVLPNAPPYRIILHLREQQGLRQTDLLPVFGSRSVASEVLSRLTEFFQLSPAIFL